MTDRAELKAKIRALLSKKVSAGCTEAEALAAAEAAARLMREHRVGQEELEIEEARVEAKSVSTGWTLVLLGAVGLCTNCAPLFAQTGRRTIITFYGRPPGPEIAAYLHQVCRRAVDNAAEEFKTSTPYKRRRSLRTKRDMLTDFRDAMARRLSVRLEQLFGDTINDAARDAAKRARDAQNPHAQTVRQQDHVPTYGEAIAAGQRAGSNVPLNPGVNGGKGAATQAIAPRPAALPAPTSQGSLF